MARYKAWVVPRGNEAVDAMSATTQALFRADLRRLEADPYSPRGLSTRAIGRDPDLRETIVADGRVIIHYRVQQDVLEVHVVRVIPWPE